MISMIILSHLVKTLHNKGLKGGEYQDILV